MRHEIGFRDKPEFLAEINMAYYVEQAGTGSLAEPIEVCGPNLGGVSVVPCADFGGVVDVPPGLDVMHRADQVIPFVPVGKVANPILMAGQEIDFESERNTNDREIRSRACDEFDVLVQFGQSHSPVIEPVCLHGAVI